MKKLKSIILAIAMTLSLPAVAFAYDYGHGRLEGNYVDIVQHGAFNTASVEQDIAGDNVFNKAEISQCGLLNSVHVDQKATKYSKVFSIKQVGFANMYYAYQH
jgi:minor curlin subunit